MRIAIGSKNPAKINAVKAAFQHYDCVFKSLEADSGVSPQPMSDEETIKGALNRASEASMLGDAEIGIGLEGGVQQTEHGLILCNWGALVERGSQPLIAGGARIPLPTEIAIRLQGGEELGSVMAEFARKKDVRKQEGAVGIFTNGRVERARMFTHVMELLAGQYEFRKKDV